MDTRGRRGEREQTGPRSPHSPSSNGNQKSEAAGGGDQTLEPADGGGERGNVPGYTPTPEDLRLREVYGDWVHVNPGTYLENGIGDNETWQMWWCDLAVMPSWRYDSPSGKVGRRFVVALVGGL